MLVKPSQTAKSSMEIGKRDAMAMGVDETGKVEEGASIPSVKTSARLQAKRQRQGEKESKDDCYFYYDYPLPSEDEQEEASQASGSDASEYEPAAGEFDVPADSDDEE